MKRYKKANEGIHAPEEVKKKAARPGRKQGYPRWAGAVAAVLAVCLIGTGVAAFQFNRYHIQDGTPLDESGGPAVLSEAGSMAREAEQPEQSDAFSAYALSMASYPEMHPYPKDEDYFADVGDGEDAWQKAHDAYSEAWDAWWEDRNALWSRTDYAGILDDFLTASAPQFLTGAGSENRVYSPLNVYMALSMLAETTGGDSRQQLLDLLQAESIEDLRARAAMLWKDNYQDDGVATSILANSLWLRDDMTYSQKTLDTLAADYYTSSFSGKMGSAEYDQALQSWINQQTRGLLAEQASGLEMSPETVLALASTIYFKAPWHDEFSKDRTEPDMFHTQDGDVETEFMRQTSQGTYYWGERFSATALSLRQSGVMWFILPDEGYTVDELLESGEAMEFLLSDKYGEYNEATREYVGGWPGQKYLNINLSMPKFDVSSDLDLIEGLQALGITDVFDMNAANFDPLEASTDDPLYVSQAQHAARVKVDEEGCEAAAYTVFMLEAGAAMPPDEEEVDFVLDRPFLFVVAGSGLPLFTGVVNQP